MKHAHIQKYFHESQIYCQDDDGTGKPRYFYVAAMEKWARANLEVEGLKPNKNYARKLIDMGTVDVDHIMDSTAKRAYYPILVCLGAAKDGDAVIVDGNHRFVCFTYETEDVQEEIGVPAYLLSPDQWKQFVVPSDEVSKLGLITLGGRI